MKNLNHIILSSLCIWLSYFPAKAQNDQGYEINCKVVGLKDGTKVYLKRNSGSGGVDTLATANAKYEKFQFKGKLSLEGDAYFVFLDSAISKKSSGAIFIDNSKITLLASVKKWPSDVIINGSEPTRLYRELTEALKPSGKKLDSLGKIYASLKKDMYNKKLSNNKDSIAIMSNLNHLDVEMEVLVKNYNKIWRDFIDIHPTSVYTPYPILKGKDVLTLKDSEEAYNKLSKKVKNSFFGVKLRQYLDVKKRIKKISLGISAPDFISTTPDGRILSLKEVIAKGKLTLVDFWGSWCKPCRAAIPGIKKIYNDFHDKGFNVLGVAAEHSTEAWKKALEEEHMPWYQVSQIKGRNEDANVIYDVNGVPAYLLIDGQGKIIAIDLPMSSNPSAGGKLRGNDLYKIVEEILGKSN